VAEYVRSLIQDEVKTDDWETLSAGLVDRRYRQQLDIWVPSRRVAFEYNGLFWHSDILSHNKRGRHHKKALSCFQKDVELFAFFSDEWDQKQELVKAMIRHRLGLSGPRLDIGRCEIRYLEKERDWNSFFVRNHLDGTPKGSWGPGMFFEGALVACAVVRGNRIIRLAVDYDYSIPNAVEQLIRLVQERVPEFVVLSDNRIENGDCYKALGFQLVEELGPRRWYTDNSVKTRSPRPEWGRVEDYGYRKWLLKPNGPLTPSPTCETTVDMNDDNGLVGAEEHADFECGAEDMELRAMRLEAESLAQSEARMHQAEMDERWKRWVALTDEERASIDAEWDWRIPRGLLP
jgi:hypothetical protein